MTIRATPTLTKCCRCGARTAAVRGPFSQSIGRGRPPQGYRLGWIRETAELELGLCCVCIAYLLPSNISTYRRT